MLSLVARIEALLVTSRPAIVSDVATVTRTAEAFESASLRSVIVFVVSTALAIGVVSPGFVK
ncbi:hypothetical protein D3C86_1777320 [compost metagenome]